MFENYVNNFKKWIIFWETDDFAVKLTGKSIKEYLNTRISSNLFLVFFYLNNFVYLKNKKININFIN